MVLTFDEACGGRIWRLLEDANREGHTLDVQVGVVAGSAFVEFTTHDGERIVHEHLVCLGALGELAEPRRSAVISLSATLSSRLAARSVAKARRVLGSM